MIRPRSIKQKLKWWVVIIFVLTGTAGWAGIWGLLYISNTAKEVTGAEVQRAEEASLVQADIAAARRADRDLLLAAVARDADKRAEQGARIRAAWARVDADIEKLRAAGHAADATALATAQDRVKGVLGALIDADAKADLAAGAYADYDKRAVELEAQAKGVADAAIGAMKTGNGQIFDWIWILQIALFGTVLACQIFSAWAGFQLSRSLTGELAELKESAERISLGDLKSEVKIATSDVEIVAVGEALDRLRVSLGKAMDRLAAKRAAPRPAEG